MKVLMFGWEFPPKIYGGLAVASYGITKGLSLQGDVQIWSHHVVVPWVLTDFEFGLSCIYFDCHS